MTREIELVQKYLDEIDNDDENMLLLENAMMNYCSNYDICQGYKEAIMLTVRDQYENHENEQDGQDLHELLNHLTAE